MSGGCTVANWLPPYCYCCYCYCHSILLLHAWWQHRGQLAASILLLLLLLRHSISLLHAWWLHRGQLAASILLLLLLLLPLYTSIACLVAAPWPTGCLHTATAATAATATATIYTAPCCCRYCPQQLSPLPPGVAACCNAGPAAPATALRCCS